MIKFTGEFEWHNKHAVALQLEQISQLIIQGNSEGDGWKIEGKDESEPKIEEEEILLNDNE